MNDERIRGTAPEDDPALVGLITDLYAIHDTSLPALLRASISRTLQEQLQTQAEVETGAISATPAAARAILTGHWPHQRQPRRRSLRAWPALLAATLVMICLVLLMVLTRQVTGGTPATGSVPTRSVSLTINGYSSTICGYRVTITRAYADANRVLVGYTIVPPSGRSYLNGFYDNAQLRTAGGAGLQGVGFGAGPEALGGAGNRFTMLGHASGSEQVGLFETTGDDPSARNATFLLSIPALITTEFAGARPATKACERYGAAGAGIRQVTIPGPFTARFTIPVQTARRATPHWVIGSGRDREVVERIVVTPTETRIYMRGSGLYRPQIQISGVQPYHGPNNSWKQGTETVIVYDDYATYFHSLYHKPNPWRLVVLSGSTPGSDGIGAPFSTLRFNLS